MDRRRWWLLAGAVPGTIACAIAAADPAMRLLGDVAVAAAGVAVATVVWLGAARRGADRRSWWLVAVACLLPVLGMVLGAVVAPQEPLQMVVLRWAPTVPAFILGSIAILTVVGRTRLRGGGLRSLVEAVLFLTAALVVVQLLLVGVDGSWRSLRPEEQLVLGAAALATSAMMAAAFTALGVIEARRQAMALVLLIGAVALTLGRAAGTAAVLSGELGVLDTSRFFVLGGLWLLATAAVIDPGRCPDGPDSPDSPDGGRSTDLGRLLPHAAMALAAVVVGAVTMAGHRPSRVTFAGLVLCAALATAHRWVSARDERRMAARLRRSEAYFRSLVRSGGDAVVILDDRLTITWASPALGRSLGPAADALPGRPLLAVAHPEDVDTLQAALAPAEDGNPLATGLLLLRLQDEQGVWRYLEAGVSDLRADADVGAVVLHCRDMTDRNAREQALQSIAYTDPLTGLPNRAGLLQALQQALQQAGTEAARAGRPAGTLLMVELEGLVTAREHAGRETVSTVIAEVGRRLRATVRAEDVVARMGGGAFAVLTEGDDSDADRLAGRCQSVVEQPIVTPVGIVDLTAAVGLVPLEGGLPVEELLRRADLAIRSAHEAGPGSSARYCPALGDSAARRDRLRDDLRGASARGELFLLFQPIVSLGEQRIAGVEAQLGWRHPDLGEVPSAEFVPIAEQAGLIGDLMRWGLAEVAAAGAGLPGAGASVNVGMTLAAGYVAGGTVVADVERVLATSGLAAERLVLQISAATVMSDDERIGMDVSTLRLMGVHVALQGFGSGDSALGHLTRLPVDVVKLDRELISRVDRDPQKRALCESVVGIVRALRLDVVAEGVETPAQLAALCGLGCDFAQGFLIARPGPLAAISAMLVDGPGALWPGLVGSS